MPRKQEMNEQFLKLPYVSRINSLLNKGNKVTTKRFKPYQRITSVPAPGIKEMDCSEDGAGESQTTSNSGSVKSTFNHNTSLLNKSQSNASWRKCILGIGKDPFTKSQSQNIDLCNNSPENIDLEVKYECFQLYNNLVENYGFPLSQSYSENLAELYSPCLKFHERCFTNVKPIEPIFPGFEKLVYSPELDVPNYCEFTEMEVSMLQRISCGCKSLSWNEFEKMFLIEQVSETKYLNDIDYETTLKDIHALFESKDYKDGLKSKKIIISENKFYRHKGPSYSTNFEVVVVNDDDPSAETFTECSLLEDPLAVCGGSTIEMVDENLVTHNFSPPKNEGKDSNTFEEINLTEEVPGEVEVSEFVTVSPGELLALQTRLKSFELHDAPLNILDSPSPSPPPAHTPQPNENIEIDIEGMKISLEEFCTSDLITFPSDMQKTSTPSEEPALVSSAPNCDVDAPNTGQCHQPLQLSESGSTIANSIFSSLPDNSSVFVLDSDLPNSMHQSHTMSNENPEVTPGAIIYSGHLDSLVGANSSIPIFQIVVPEDQVDGRVEAPCIINSSQDFSQTSASENS